MRNLSKYVVEKSIRFAGSKTQTRLMVQLSARLKRLRKFFIVFFFCHKINEFRISEWKVYRISGFLIILICYFTSIYTKFSPCSDDGFSDDITTMSQMGARTRMEPFSLLQPEFIPEQRRMKLTEWRCQWQLNHQFKSFPKWYRTRSIIKKVDIRCRITMWDLIKSN